MRKLLKRHFWYAREVFDTYTQKCKKRESDNVKALERHFLRFVKFLRHTWRKDILVKRQGE
jgi:hypothetical protein